MLGHWENWIAEAEALTSVFYTEESAPGRKNLSDVIINYLAAFARTGNPNGGNLPAWEPFTIDGAFKAIEFDVNFADNSPRITVDEEIYTVESVLADLEANLEEPTRSEVREVLLSHISESEY